MASTRSTSRISDAATGTPERTASPAASPSPADQHGARSKSDLPPSKPKEDRGLSSNFRKPFARVRFATFVSVLTGLLLVLLAWYAYHTTLVAVDAVRGTVSATTARPAWRFLFGGRSSGAPPAASGDADGARASGVEHRIEELAAALGMQSADLAGAIASAVREHVPPASLSSVASAAQETGGSAVVDALLGDQDRSRGGMGGVSDALGSVVGLDDVPEF
ncbi:hypothetical protein BC834DRAFT_252608 [Gloeopeniophorella convolvens]|nr:hypothetical protein BC834DRAFT_252608 [Gloeopeniophorella convolvens]